MCGRSNGKSAMDERKSTQGTNKTLMTEPFLHVPSFRSGIGLAGCPEQGLVAALGRHEEFKHMYVCVWKISGDALDLLWEQPMMGPCFGGGRAVFLPGQTALLPTLLFVTNWDARKVCIFDAHSGKQRGSFRTHAAPLGIAVYGHPPTVAVSLWSSSDVVLYRPHCSDRDPGCRDHDTGWHIAKIIRLARYVQDLWFSSNGSMLVVLQQACCYVGFWDSASSRMVKSLSFMQPPQTIELRNDRCVVAFAEWAFGMASSCGKRCWHGHDASLWFRCTHAGQGLVRVSNTGHYPYQKYVGVPGGLDGCGGACGGALGQASGGTK